ncbi:MAG: hypothetical protein WDW38_006198 [Sanguina aurantia]
MYNNALANQAEYVARWNSGAAANGGLMRIAPLAIWAHARTTNAELIALAKQDALLSHPSEVCQDANAVYCVAIAALLKSGRAGGSSTQERAATAIRAVDSVIGVMDEVIQRWYRDSSTLTLEEIVVTHLIGHVKHAFLLAFYFLRRGTAYDVAIVETCRKLGDSDTNAAIVGALLGALHGSSGIPQHMSRPVLAFDCAAHNPQLTGRGHWRPATYRTKDAMALLPSLLGVEQPLRETQLNQLSTAIGCLLGLFVGDAVGVTMEGCHETNPVKLEVQVQRALKVYGGRSASAINRVNRVIDEMHEDVRKWFKDSITCSLDDIVATPNVAHVKHAFKLAFFFLHKHTRFEEALAETCRKLGDTDTNCAVVGAVMGALHGKVGVPQSMSEPVLMFDCATHDPVSTGCGKVRPATYRIRDVMALLPALISL